MAEDGVGRRVRARGWEERCETACSGHTMAVGLMDSQQQLWLLTQDLHKSKPFNDVDVLAGMEEVTWLHPVVEEFWAISISTGMWLLVGFPCCGA